MSGLGFSIRAPSPVIESGEKNYESLNASMASLTKRNLGYRSRIYNIITKDGKKVIRKVANFANEKKNRSKKGIFLETKNEIANYELLRTRPGSEIYIMPYLYGKVEQDLPYSYAYLDFQTLNGDDLITVLNQLFKNINTSDTELRKKIQSDIIFLLQNTARALQWLVSQGYLHGDIKSDNFFVEPSGNVRLLDLGMLEKIEIAINNDILSDMKKIKVMIDEILIHASLPLERIQQWFDFTTLYLPQFDEYTYPSVKDFQDHLQKSYDKLINESLLSPPPKGGKRKSSFSRKSKGKAKKRQTRKRA